MKISTVIFDWAGTTVDFGCCGPVGAVQEAFRQFGVEPSETDARRPMGLLKRDHIAAMMTYPEIASAWQRVHNAAPGEREIDRVHDAFVAIQESALCKHADLIPGVLETVAQLREMGIKIGSTTGYTRAMLQPVAEAAAKQGYTPDASVTPDEVGYGRPHPFMILQNMVKLGAWPLNAVIKVGDTPVDVEEGLNAGVWSVGVAGTGNGIGMPREKFDTLAESEREERLRASRRQLLDSGAHFVIDSLSELVDVVYKIEAQEAK